MTAPTKSPIARRFASGDEWRELARRFESGDIPHGDWDHASHIAMGAWYLLWHDFDTALDHVRSGIQALNARHEAEGAIVRVGYHETITRFYMRMIEGALARHRLDGPLVTVLNDVIEQLNDRALPFAYYSNERLFSADARAGWVSPDLKPL